MNPAYLPQPDGHKLAYRKTEGEGTGVIFLGGFRSDMKGNKAIAVEEYCRANNRPFIRFDYYGHGESSGDFTQGTIGQWADNVVSIIDEVAGDEPQILVGSSMGGWLMLLAALKRPKRVAGLVGIASAPDFTELLIWDKLTPEQQAELRENGSLNMPNCYDDAPYIITFKLIAESGEHLVLDDDIDIHCPVSLIHGMKDEDVPWEFSLTLNEKLKSKQVKTTLVDDGDHRMSSEKHLQILVKHVKRMADLVAAGEEPALVKA